MKRAQADLGTGTVVVVDDDEHIRFTLKRTLEGQFHVVCFESATEAVEYVRQGKVSVVLSDINMPGMTGLELLRAIREFDGDLPVVLLTGEPTLKSATEAIELGVFGYIEKPFHLDEVRDVVVRATKLHHLALMKREALRLQGVPVGPSDRISLEVTFRQALESLWVAFQPIISMSKRSVFGFEALLRSGHAALPGPAEMLDAAERLGALHDLGRLIRSRVAAHADAAEGEPLLFVNLHPQDLMDPELTDERSPLASLAPRIVLEITERASLAGLKGVQARVAALRALGFRIAVDDLGAGYAGLTSFALLEPEIVKVDMTLTRGIDQSPIKQKLVGSLTGLCRDMGMTIVVEGVETAAEREALVALGCDLLQGYHFARPGPPFPTVTW